MTALTNAVNGVLDNLANLLSRFPAGPFNDVLAGALLLTRRALSLIEPTPSPTSGPVATSVWLPNAGTYGTNAEMKFVVNFDQPVIVKNANVALPVEINYVLSNAKYVSGSGTGSLLFSLNTPAEELDPSGIDLGTVSTQTGVRVFEFVNPLDPLKNPRIVSKRTGLAASNAIPTVNTSNVKVDSMGPQITGRSDLQVSGSKVTLTVTFDRPVTVTGTPTVPVVVNGVDTVLNYAGGNRTDALTFSLNNPSGATVSKATFRPFVGDVIYLSPTAGINDRTGSPIYTLEGDIDTPLIENGNRVVVIGQHFENLGPVSKDQLDAILAEQVKGSPTVPVGFYYGLDAGTYGPPLYPEGGPWPFNSPYQLPTPTPAKVGVDLYRVAYRSSVPEENRFTTAYGIAAIPAGAKENIPVVVWQQPTVFNLKDSAPSLAFSCGATPTCATQAENAFPRFNIAQFGGQGYAVFMPDPYGLGNSPNHYAYQLVGSAAQWSTDMLKAGQALLAAEGLKQSKLFLAGWSAGGNQTAAFLEGLQSQGQTVSGTVIASSPLDVGTTVENGIFDPRTWTAEHTGDAVWLNVALAYTAFSMGGFQGEPSTALELFGKYYDTARRIYTQQYIGAPALGLNNPNDPLSQGITVSYLDVDGAVQTSFLPYNLRELIVPKYSSGRVAYNTSSYAKLMNKNGTGDKLWTSPVMMNYGSQDEVLPFTAGEKIYKKQQDLGNKSIQFNLVNAANHRGTYLRAMANALEWYDSLSGIIIETPSQS